MKNLLNILKFIYLHPLARKSLLKSYYRFFFWQIITRLGYKSQVFKYVNNTKLYVKKGSTISTGNYYVGLLEFNEMTFILHFLNKDDIFFDIGANIGSYAILASGISEAKTICFEPIQETFNDLKNNIKLNCLEEKIFPLNIGLSDKQGKLMFTTQLDAKNHIINSENECIHYKELEVRQLDDFAYYKPTLIKIDVEGYELYILKGAKKILQSEQLKVIIIEINNECKRYQIEENEIHHLLSSYEFKLFGYTPFSRRLDNNLSHTDNKIYIRDIEMTKKKIQQSPKIKIRGVTF